MRPKSPQHKPACVSGRCPEPKHMRVVIERNGKKLRKMTYCRQPKHIDSGVGERPPGAPTRAAKWYETDCWWEEIK